MQALLEAVRMDTREDPDFWSGIDDFAVDEDECELIREVYMVFQSYSNLR